MLILSKIFIGSIAVLLPPFTASRNNVHSTFIIDGDEISNGLYPWFVDGGSCGGVLVAPEFVLTAAHCGPGLNSVLTIGRQCKFNHNCRQEVERIEVEEKFYSPLWDYNTADYLLVKLKKRSAIRPVKMDNGNLSKSYRIGKKLWVAGFGKTSTDSESKELLHVQQTYISNPMCNEMWGRESTGELEMCTYSSTGSHDGACFGDSGGPLYDAEAEKVVGIVSWGDVACSNNAVVYARVSGQIDWIHDTICNNHDTLPKPSFCGRRDDNTNKASSSHFLIQSEFSNILSWCLKPQYVGESTKIVMAQCDEQASLQHWWMDKRGQLRTRNTGPNNHQLCLNQNGQTNNLQLQECHSGNAELKKRFIYNSFDGTILWLRSGSNFVNNGLRALTMRGPPPTNTDVGIMKLDGKGVVEGTQEWRLIPL